MIRELVPFTQAEGTLPADLEPVVNLVTQGYLDRDRPDNMAPCSSPAPKSLSLSANVT